MDDIGNPVRNAQWVWLEIHKCPQNFVNFNRNSRKTVQIFAKFWNSSRFWIRRLWNPAKAAVVLLGNPEIFTIWGVDFLKYAKDHCITILSDADKIWQMKIKFYLLFPWPVCLMTNWTFSNDGRFSQITFYNFVAHVWLQAISVFFVRYPEFTGCVCSQRLSARLPWDADLGTSFWNWSL